MEEVAGATNLISRFTLTSNAPRINLLQSEGDTLIFCDAVEDQSKTSKLSLYSFKWCLKSKLKVNFFNSKLMRVRAKTNYLHHLADILICKEGHLWLPISAFHCAMAMFLNPFGPQ